jgi:predicted transglutaminase-like cysteine proteinase
MSASASGSAKRRLPFVAIAIASVVCASTLPADARERRRAAVPRPAPPAVSLESAARDAPRYFSIAAVLAQRSGGGQPPAPSTATAAAATTETVPLLETRPQAARGSDTAADEPFADRGYRLFPPAVSAVSLQWAALRRDMSRDLAQVENCRHGGSACRDAAARQFAGIVDRARTLSEQARVTFVNETVNAAIAYSSDAAIHGVPDRWSSALASLGARGDCEDYAAAKYAMLHASGFAHDRMRIVLLRDRQVNDDHAVLAVRLAGGWQILDNRWNRIDAAEALTHYHPVFALTDAGSMLYAAPYAEAAPASPGDRVALRGSLRD